MPSRHLGCLFLIVSAALASGCGGVIEHEIPLSVLSFNMRHNVDCWEERMELIADGIEQLAPDVVGLQEIEHAVEQGEILVEMLEERGLDYELRQAKKSGLAGDLTGEGIGIMSRSRVLEVEPLDLSDGRVAMWARVVHQGLLVDVFNTHLSAGGDEAAIRVQQMEDVLAFADGKTGAQLQVLTGDMNAEPEDEPIARADAARFVDLWDLARAGDDGFTTGIDLVEAKDGVEQTPDRRIDYVFARSVSSGGGAYSADVEVVLDERAPDGLYPSDHTGVLAELRWDTSPEE